MFVAARCTAGAATSLNQTAHNYVSHSPFAGGRRTVSQENARLTNACGSNCTAVGVVPVAGGVFKRVGEPSVEAIKVALKELNQALDAVALQKLQVLQQQRMGEITQLFNRQDAANSVTFAGKSYPAVTNPAGTTKTFDTSGLAPGELQTRVFEFAKELTGGVPIEPVLRNGVALEGRWAAKLPDGTTVNVRSVSSSNVGRWTVDVKGPLTTQNNLPKYELKFQ